LTLNTHARSASVRDDSDARAERVPFQFRPDAVLWLVLALTALRLIYLLFFCPYELVEDEAHYWEWSRRLDLSYYTKGPGVAWAIAASTWIFGVSEFAVRLPSVLSAAISTLAIGAITREAFGDRRAAFIAAALFNLAPVFQFASFLMTIDSPYVACWACATLSMVKAAKARSAGGAARWALAMGASLGVGFLFKYTILLVAPGMILAFGLLRRSATPREGSDPQTSRGHRAHRRVSNSSGPERSDANPLDEQSPDANSGDRHPRDQPGDHLTPRRAGGLSVFMLALIAFLASASPVFIWNARQGFPTVRHLLGHLGVAGGDVPVKPAGEGGWNYNPAWTFELLGLQAVLMGATIALVISGVIATFRSELPARDRDPARAMIRLAAPIFVFYLAVTFFTNAEGNWPIAGFVTLLALAARRTSLGMAEFESRLAAWRALPEPRPWAGVLRRKPETAVQAAWHASVTAGIVVGVLMLRVDLLAGLPFVGQYVPLGRLMGARTQAAHIDRLTADLRERTALEPIAIVQHYGQASRLAFYLDGRPVVYCASSFTGGRRTQYDYFPQTDLRSPVVVQSLMRRPAVVVGGVYDQWTPVFDRVEDLGSLDGETKKDRKAFVGFGFKGFP
jgi:Dolichyl-phosphate-mannose-protein mannosyltransferase